MKVGKQCAQVALVIGGYQIGELTRRCRVGQDNKAQQE